MDFSSFERLISDSKNLGIMGKGDEAHLYGFGEPTLYKELDLMIRLLSDSGLKTKINTNGLYLEPRLWDRLSSAGLSECLFSFDATDQKTYEKYRVGGNFNNLVRNATYASRNPQKTRVELQFIVFAHNIRQIDQFVALSEKIGADVATIKRPRTWDGASRDFEGLKDLPDHYVRKQSQDGCKFSKSYGFVLQDGSLTICSADAFGRYSIGNIFQMGPILWLSGEFQQLRDKVRNTGLDICENCGYGEAYVQKISLKR